jgi:hypothetical protein
MFGAQRKPRARLSQAAKVLAKHDALAVAGWSDQQGNRKACRNRKALDQPRPLDRHKCATLRAIGILQRANHCLSF